MIKVIVDEDAHEADVDLINDFAMAVIDKDKHLLDEVVYLAHGRIEKRCRCYQAPCICEEQ